MNWYLSLPLPLFRCCWSSGVTCLSLTDNIPFSQLLASVVSHEWYVISEGWREALELWRHWNGGDGRWVPVSFYFTAVGGGWKFQKYWKTPFSPIDLVLSASAGKGGKVPGYPCSWDHMIPSGQTHTIKTFLIYQCQLWQPHLNVQFVALLL